MTVKDFIEKIGDSYLDLKISVIQENDIIQSYMIKEHKWKTFNIPNYVLNFQIDKIFVMLDMVIINIILEDNQKRPVLKKFPVGMCPTCPNCGIYLSKNHYQYCSDCGQPLDWNNYSDLEIDNIYEHNDYDNNDNNNQNHKIIGWEYQIAMFNNGYYDIVANSTKKQLFKSKQQAELDALHLINSFLVNKYNKSKKDFYITCMSVYNK